MEAPQGGVTALEAHKLTVSEASRLIRGGKLSPSELLEGLLERIDALEPKLEAWVTVDRDGARVAASRLSREAEDGRIRGPLHGVPVGVKDIYYTAGLKTTMGSHIYRDFVPEKDAETVRMLKEAGAVILGKTETTEFAVRDPAPTRNPWNTEHSPGGSSSGSAAAVSSGMCPVALGTQTGGSVIRPASFCGVVGMKPTYDLISRDGIYPLSWSLDHVGFFTRTVEDAAIVLGVLTRGDPRAAPWIFERTEPPRLGFLRGYFQEKAREEVWDGFEDALDRLSGSGAEVVEVPQPGSFNAAQASHRVIMASEAASVHEGDFEIRRAEYRVNIRGHVSSGLLAPASAYLRAQRIRAKFIREVEAILGSVNCLLTPSAPTPAPWGLESTGDPAFNSPWSLCGFPTMTVPSGLTGDDLPLGVQLTAPNFHEGDLLAVAEWCERSLGFKGSRPEL